MLSITDGGSLARALASPLDDSLKRLLKLRRDQLGGDITGEARFIIVQPGDPLNELETELGFAIAGNRNFAPEWCEDHGSFYEVVWILDDSGFAHVALVPKATGANLELLDLCASHADQHASLCTEYAEEFEQGERP